MPMIKKDPEAPPIIYVVDWSEPPPKTCPVNRKLQHIMQSGGAGLIMVTVSPPNVVNKCTMMKNSPFFYGFMDVGNYSLIKEKLPMEALLTIELKNRDVELIEVWTSALSSSSYQTISDLGAALNNLPSLRARIKWEPRIASLGCTNGHGVRVCDEAQFV